MSYQKKKGRKITKFFGDYEFSRVEKSCKRYQGLMEPVGLKKLDLQWSSIQRFDAMCVVPTGISGGVADELYEEIERDLPCQTQRGEARITDLGDGLSRVQIPVFPA